MASEGRIPGLDGLRALAAGGVMFFHATSEGPAGWLQSAGDVGRTGVDLFFVLSGFLITRILLEARGERGALGNFYARRTLRIFPLYFLGLAVYLVMLPLVLGRSPAPLSAQVWSWAFLANIPDTFHSIPGVGPPHYWSLAVEEHFYLLWPFLVLTLPLRALPAMLGALVVAGLVSRGVLAAARLDAYYLTPARLDGLALGALVALVRSPFPRLILAARGAVIALPLAIAAIYLAYSGGGLAWVQVAKFLLIAVFFAAVLALLLWDPRARWVVGALEVPPLVWLGRISFGLYVWHFLTLGVVMGTTLPGLVKVPLAVGFTVAVAALSFYAYERPLLRLKRFFPTRQPRPSDGTRLSSAMAQPAAAVAQRP